jgi:phospholipase/lecithinase/hemolysin
MAASPVHAGPLDELIVFGDSHSDAGNWQVATSGSFPGWPYYQGRFSNGPVWVDYLADALGFPRADASGRGGTNFAWGGARTGTGFDYDNPWSWPKVGSQIDQYLSRTTPAESSLFVIFAGHNDFAWGTELNYQRPLTNLQNHIRALSTAGARHFVVPNLHPLGHLPGYRGGSREATLNTLSSQFNDALPALLSGLESELGITIFEVDLAHLIDEVIVSPSDFGFANVTGRAYTNVVASNPNQYLYWDSDHFTTKLYELLGITAANVIKTPDFNLDGIAGVADLDQLVLQLRAMRNGADSDAWFDLNRDGLVDEADMQSWLAQAATENGFAEPYTVGDTNLDGIVNFSDFVNLNNNWQATHLDNGMPVAWSSGDFDGNGMVDFSDFVAQNNNWQRAIALASRAAVPEPSAYLLLVVGGICLRNRLRGCREMCDRTTS